MAKLLTQEKANQILENAFKNTPYILTEPFQYIGKRKTYVKITCTKHNETFTIPWYKVLNFKKDNCHILQDCSGCIGSHYKRNELTKEICIELAKKCSGRKEYKQLYGGCYCKAVKEKFLNELWSFIKIKGNKYKRCIYVYIFENVNNEKYVYVGLTNNLEYRHLQHCGKVKKDGSSVLKFCENNNIEIPNPIQLTEYIDKDIASKLEGEILNDYINNGYNSINKCKCGGLGGSTKSNSFTYDECLDISKKYRTRSEWRSNDYTSYYFGMKMNWLDTLKPSLKKKKK